MADFDYAKCLLPLQKRQPRCAEWKATTKHRSKSNRDLLYARFLLHSFARMFTQTETAKRVRGATGLNAISIATEDHTGLQRLLLVSIS